MSRVSNFEFAVHNNGMLYGDWSYEPGAIFGLHAPLLAHWPRGSYHLQGDLTAKGFMLLAKKGSQKLASDAGFMRPASTAHGPFDSMVPGLIGDPKAGYDTLYNGAGWLYVDDPNYIVYSSLDYDHQGVDISGNNYDD